MNVSYETTNRCAFGPFYPAALQPTVDHAERLWGLVAVHELMPPLDEWAQAWVVGRSEEIARVTGDILGSWNRRTHDGRGGRGGARRLPAGRPRGARGATGVRYPRVLRGAHRRVHAARGIGSRATRPSRATPRRPELRRSQRGRLLARGSPRHPGGPVRRPPRRRSRGAPSQEIGRFLKLGPRELAAVLKAGGTAKKVVRRGKRDFAA